MKEGAEQHDATAVLAAMERAPTGLGRLSRTTRPPIRRRAIDPVDVAFVKRHNAPGSA